MHDRVRHCGPLVSCRVDSVTLRPGSRRVNRELASAWLILTAGTSALHAKNRPSRGPSLLLELFRGTRQFLAVGFTRARRGATLVGWLPSSRSQWLSPWSDSSRAWLWCAGSDVRRSPRPDRRSIGPPRVGPRK